ncbi:hypothetical protein ABIE41_000119 [Bosea sp. OAE506]|uniref:hypothetical protein n=1 Tax=Bosea sp. OAE506 TaxID=2663870 RepID=UPI00178A26A3
MTIKSITRAHTPANERAARPPKLKGFRVTLYGEYSRPLFQWNGKAETAAKAEILCCDIYELAVQALCQTQGVTASLSALDLKVSASNVQTSSAAEGWRIRFDVPDTIKGQKGARCAGLPDQDLLALVASAALTDPACRDAARDLCPMRVGFWYCHAGSDGLEDVGACLLVSRNGREVRHSFENAALCDALRFVSLRTSIPFGPGTGLPRFHPFPGPTCKVMLPSSATIRTICLTEPPQPPQLLLTWLDREGYGIVADRLRASGGWRAAVGSMPSNTAAP